MLQERKSLHCKKPSNLSYQPLRQISHLSPYHERVIMEKRYLQQKEHLRSILIMGHLQKMQLNAINNRSIQTIRKMKAAQEMSKKRFSNQRSSSESDRHQKQQVKLKIDNRKKNKDRTKSETVDEKQKIKTVEEVYQKLIDDYVKKVSKEKLLQKGYQRNKIIQEACQTIRAQLTNNFPNLQAKSNDHVLRPSKKINQKRKSLSHSSNRSINLPSISFDSPNGKRSNRSSNQRQELIQKSNNENMMILGEFFKQNKNQESPTYNKQRLGSCNRLLTEVECVDSLKQLEMQQKYLSKQRMRNQKLFLRKMKLIGAKSIRALQKSSRLEERPFQ